jgi:hypothetical protein
VTVLLSIPLDGTGNFGSYIVGMRYLATFSCGELAMLGAQPHSRIWSEGSQ